MPTDAPDKTASPPPSVQHARIDAGHEGQRIDNFLMGRLKGVPRAHVYRILRRGEARVNKGRIRPDYRLRTGDIVRIPPLRYRESATGAPNAGVLGALENAILFEDAGLLVLDKPSGMAVHGGSGQRYGVIEALRALRPHAPYLELVHRLDRETSGCLVIAKKRSALRVLHEGLREHRLDKRYLLLVGGEWRGKGRKVEMELRKNILSSGERVVRQDATGKPSVTHLRPLAVGQGVSLLEARTLTGRTHQIRVHAATLGHPVAGDEKYGARETNRKMHRLGLRRLFLHASSLAFQSDRYGLSVTAPLPRELARVLNTMGIDPP
uniref:Pseudouridine synthase n=1 Tax=Candidatus Kentrum sp. UNK TaxID=2126344 RepID=A0A451AZN7_9GAMM|nr:MAG: 23S rRNA pseudouridine955/2504/2580 synthase [Candidatus Kentron sp. UNK]VFK71494.1 MAG: 23S rRNA pseudouridine955/2504/2580 synthase [Candidatus Kentron sp. UNK]